MMSYEDNIFRELEIWRARMHRRPSFASLLATRLQARINRVIPEKIHAAITAAIKQITRAVFFGAEFTSYRVEEDQSLEQREQKINERIKFYRQSAAVEGALTGAGGILLGLADFPLWLAMKMKMLFEIAACYGFATKDYKERIYILYIFELTFSSQSHRRKIIEYIENWETLKKQMPATLNEFDWRSFQQEYRDYIDIAKLLQLIPGIGAPIGAYVNHRLTNKLGKMAMNAYRLRWRITQKIAGQVGSYPAIS